MLKRHQRNQYDNNNNSEESLEVVIEDFNWQPHENVIIQNKEKVNITKKDAFIFCRVSSYGQTGPFCISFEAQEHYGQVCANKFGLKLMGTVKIVESAYTGKACTIKSLITKCKGKNIIIYDVSRFCRNIDRGMELLDYALRCNTRLFFVSEGIVWDKEHTENRGKIRDRLYLAQEESINIGRRVRDAKAEKKRRGFHTGGLPKYGYKVVETFGGKILEPEEYEQNVIKFIHLCLKTGTPVNTLNILMENISPNFEGCPIILEANGNVTNYIQEPLSYTEIADLLNIYNVPKRLGRWSASSIASISKREVDDVLDAFGKMDVSSHLIKLNPKK
ncbi:MAG TPA: recombinase family protein [Saprospiraceae bacterium]|nr:recombinase family protein [Saprospiraceae bacterium]